MNELVEKKDYVQNSVAISRKQEEQLFSTLDSNYSVLASLLTFEKIDSLSEVLGDFAGKVAVKKVYDNQYFEPRYGKFRNFFTRNIYVNPIKKERMKVERELTYDGVRLLTETFMKGGSRAISKVKYNKKKYDSYLEVYSMLHMYASELPVDNNDIALKVELRKMLGCFDLKDSDREKLKKEVEKNNIKRLDLLSGNLINNADDETAVNISYLLYVLANTKYNNEEQIEKSLLSYYSYLGFHEKQARDIMKQNEQSYKTVERDQHRMINISRQMIGQLFIEIPEFDIDKIMSRGAEIAKFDPYCLRRRSVQKNIREGLATAKKLTIQQLTSYYPELSMLAASESLAQFNLTDNMKENAYKKLMQWNSGDNSICDSIMNNSSVISEETMKQKG